MSELTASNPGRVKVEFFKTYLRYHYFQKYILITLAIIFLPFLIGMALFSLIAAAVCAGLWYGILGLAIYFRRNYIYEQFYHGDLRPGVVVGLNPMMIAVQTDLVFMSPKEYPVIKMIRYELPAIGGEEPKVGKRVATVALYYVTWKCPHFNDFNPIPVECATDDVKIQRRAVKRIPAEDWQLLKEDLRYIEKPYRYKLYKLWQ
ncbi:MAG: DUF3239 domain-containing protein [Planctomycetaceae bacterium]